MKTDDPRHGTTYGWKLHRAENEATCPACRAAVAAYQNRRANDAYLGRPHAMPHLGFARRIEALQAIGWSFNDIADHMGSTASSVQRALARGKYVTRSIHDRTVTTYEALSMTVPDDRFANRRRLIASRKGYAPPLAWDDIDTDLEPIVLEPVPHTRDGLIDQVAIDRALAGDKSVKLTITEKRAATAQWERTGQSLSELGRVTGWNPDRYLTRAAA